MRMYNKDNKLVIITESQTFHFVLPKDAGNNLKHEIDFVIKCLAYHTIKNKISQLLPNYIHGNNTYEHTKQ